MLDATLLPFVLSFITIFVIMNPFASILPFITLTKNCKDSEMRSVATTAVVIAGIIAILFIFGGSAILSFMRITLNDLKVAGGIILGLMGLENVLGITIRNGKKSKKSGMEAAAVLIATPLLTGPALLSTLLMLVSEYGFFIPVVSLFVSLLVAWLILVNALWLRKITGEKIILFMSKVIGLVLLAMAISLIRSGLS